MNAITENTETAQTPDTGIATIVAMPRPWYERPGDLGLELDDALTHAKELYSASVNREMTLEDFQVTFSKGKVYVEGRHTVGGFRYPLGHWAFEQLCKLVNAPAAFLRTLPGQLAVDCLNHKLRNRKSDVAIYRVTRSIQGHEMDEIRAFTSTRYRRFFDHQLLEWVRKQADLRGQGDKPYVLLCDRGVETTIGGAWIQDPEHAFRQMQLRLLVGNSEVGAASISTRAAICGGHWRIPVTLAGARIRHVGKVDEKASEKLRDAMDAFTRADAKDLSRLVADRNQEETKSRGEWYAWLKARKVGKSLADRILPEGDGQLTTTRYRLAVRLAIRAAEIPYFTDRLEQELVASKVLGI